MRYTNIGFRRIEPELDVRGNMALEVDLFCRAIFAHA